MAAYPDGDYLTHYLDDDYPEPWLADEEPHDPTSESPTWDEIWVHCVCPTWESGALHIGKVLLWALIFRVTTQGWGRHAARPGLRHGLAIATGTVAAAHFFYLNVLYLLALTALTYPALSLAHRVWGAHRGPLVTLVVLAFNLTVEWAWASPLDWHQVRGAQMILAMKLISLAFDWDRAGVRVEPAPQPEPPAAPRGRRRAPPAPPVVPPLVDYTRLPTVLEYFGYAINPGTTVFGPWLTFEDYLRAYDRPIWNWAWLVKLGLSVVYGFLFLSISTCWNPWLIPEGAWNWWSAYRDALSFRASHYFVSYVSEATAVAAGFGSGPSGEWQCQVVHPHNVEVPRSLTEVVKAWNVPMHLWLKRYCFKVARPYGTGVAVLVTYLASTMLHGLNFQLGAVLLSLGIYTLAEFQLRSRLATILDASIHASQVLGQRFKYAEGSVVAITINFVFGLIASFNLAYLGVMFNQDESMSEGYSWRHTLDKWAELDFASTWLMAGMMCLALVI